MALRDYQQEAVNEARRVVMDGGNPVVVIPTGGGKTHVGVAITKGAVARGGSVVWIAHREELIDQAAARLDTFGVRNGIVMGSRPATPNAPVQVASIQTLANRDKPPARVIILDEAHHVRARTYQHVLDAYPDAAVVGLTATPVRLDGRGLGECFDAIVAPVTCNDLIDRGYLMEPRYYAPTQPDFKGVRKVGGDYTMGGKNGAAKVMMRSTIMGSVVEHYTRLAKGRKAVVFACSIEHSKALVERFNAAGFRAAHVDGTTPKTERASILTGLRDGRLEVVSNVNVLTEGWDLPALEACIVARPTDSWALHLQMIGRVMRVEEGKDRPIVIDHCGNVVRHGFPTDPVEYDLSDASRRKGDAPVAKVCKVCFATVPVAASVCPACGAPFPRRPRTGPERVDGDLREVDSKRPTQEAKAAFYERVCKVAMGLGYVRGWATKRYVAEFGVKPRGPWFRPMMKKLWAACTHVRRHDHGGCRFCNHGTPDTDRPRWAKGPQW